MNTTEMLSKAGMACVLAFLIQTGCAQTPPTPEGTAFRPFDPLDPGETIGVAAAESSVQPSFWRPDTTRGEAAGEGLKTGAGRGARGGALPGVIITWLCPPCAIIGLPLAAAGALGGAVVGGTIGAIGGGASVETNWTATPITGIVGAQELFDASLGERRIAGAIRDRVLEIAPASAIYDFRLARLEPDSPVSPAEQSGPGTVLRIKVEAFGLVTDGAEDDPIGLLVRAAAASYWVGPEIHKSRNLGEWAYSGDRRVLREWAENDAALFREEIDRAVQELADAIVQSAFRQGSEGCHVAQTEGSSNAGTCERLRTNLKAERERWEAETKARLQEERILAEQERQRQAELAEQERQRQAELAELERRASQGDADAQWELYVSDRHVAEGLKWVCLAANQGYPKAQLELGRLYWYGLKQFEEDHVRGYMWYNLAALSASSGSRRGEIEVRDRRPQLAPGQLAEAKRLVSEWEPDPASCDELAEAARQQDANLAKRELPAEQEDAAAQWELYLGDRYSAEGRRWLCLAANQGYPEAQVELGRLYWGGYILTRFEEDRVRGYMWYKLAASSTSAIRLRDEIQLNERNPQLAPGQLAAAERLAAEWEPDPSFCEGLAKSGEQTEQEVDLAELEGRAKQGNAKAAWDLFVRTDEPMNLKWLCLAANNGLPKAQAEAGKRMWYGIPPVWEDRVRGYVWYKLAALAAPEAWQGEVHSRKSDLAPEQLVEAERLLAEWKPSPSACEFEDIATPPSN